jgi:hypothetical protein
MFGHEFKFVYVFMYFVVEKKHIIFKKTNVMFKKYFLKNWRRPLCTTIFVNCVTNVDPF